MSEMTDPADVSPLTGSEAGDEAPLGLPKRLRNTRDVQDEVPTSAVERTRPDRLGRALELAIDCARIAQDSRARDVLVLDLSVATPLVDYFVIATAGSRRQSNAIASDIDAEMKKRGEAKLGLEGSEEGRWILIDYGDFVVHVFNEEAREYYALEDIWGDAKPVEWADPQSSSPPDRPRPAAPAPAPEPFTESTIDDDPVDLEIDPDLDL